jgi:DNA-binding transcriptional LysR family regulator
MTAELRHIEAFLAVSRCGTFTRAAAELHLSQPALTVQIRQLESALGLVVRVRDVVAARVVDLVKSGDADFGISGLGHGDRDVVERALFVDRLAAFAPSAHAIATTRAVTLRELAVLPLILTGRDSSVRAIVDDAVRRERLSVTIAHEATYMTTALGMAAAGLGIAILPEAARASAPAALRMVPIRRPVLQRQLGLVMKAGRSLSPAAQKLVDTLART